jgi:hypothetical protein
MHPTGPATGPLSSGFGGAPRGIRTPNRQIRSLPLIVRLVPCGPPVLLTSQNLVLPVRLVACRPSVALSYPVKKSVNDGLPGGRSPDVLSGAHRATPAVRTGGSHWACPDRRNAQQGEWSARRAPACTTGNWSSGPMSRIRPRSTDCWPAFPRYSHPCGRGDLAGTDAITPPSRGRRVAAGRRSRCRPAAYGRCSPSRSPCCRPSRGWTFEPNGTATAG